MNAPREVRKSETNGRVEGGPLPSGQDRALLVREMFDRIAGRYELLNNVMTAGMHRIWNKKVVKAADLRRNGWAP